MPLGQVGYGTTHPPGGQGVGLEKEGNLIGFPTAQCWGQGVPGREEPLPTL